MRKEATIRKELERLERSQYAKYTLEEQRALIWVLGEGGSLASGRTKDKDSCATITKKE